MKEIMKPELPDFSYAEVLNKLKHRIKTAQVKAALSVNKEMIILYWEIGKTISDKQNNEGWGSKIVDRLAHDLKISFPELKGFSSRNLKYMKKFAETYSDFEFMQQLAAQIPWFRRIGADRGGYWMVVRG